MTGLLCDGRELEDHEFVIHSQEEIDKILSRPGTRNRQALKELCVGPAVSFNQLGSSGFYRKTSRQLKAMTGLTVFDTCLMWHADFLFLDKQKYNIGRVVYFDNEYTPELVATKVLTHMLNGEVYLPSCVQLVESELGCEFYRVVEEEY